MNDYYNILGVTKEASSSEIKKAYRKVAMKYHPDRNPDNKEAENKFKEAAEAYSVLSDATKKAQYDQFGHDNYVNSNAGSSSGFSNMDANDIFSMFGDLFSSNGGSSPFESFFGGKSNTSNNNSKNNLKISISLTLEEIFNGLTKKIKIKRWERIEGSSSKKCHKCSGSGELRFVQSIGPFQQVNVKECTSCDGVGYIGGRDKKTAMITIEIPPGVSDGQYLIERGQGNQNISHSGKDGDLIVYFKELEHALFTRNNNDIYIECIINYADAILGTEIKVPTLGGNVKFNIPPGVQNGTMIRLKDKGIKELNRYKSGDQYVRILVDIPKSISNETKKIVENLKVVMNNKIEFKKISN